MAGSSVGVSGRGLLRPGPRFAGREAAGSAG